MITALPRLINPQPLEQLGIGLAISVVASLINLGVALVLMRAGKQYGSITLEADARHLMTDVWTTVGVLVGIVLVWITGWLRLDPIIAMLVAVNILYTGYRLLKRSGRGLMDVALPPNELASVKSILDSYQEQGVKYHALRSRQAAARKFLAVHLLVPGRLDSPARPSIGRAGGAAGPGIYPQHQHRHPHRAGRRSNFPGRRRAGPLGSVDLAFCLRDLRRTRLPVITSLSAFQKNRPISPSAAAAPPAWKR